MLVPIVGAPVRALPPSATTATSARSRSAWPTTRSGRCSVEHSSSPSTTTLIVTGGAPSARSARIAAAWIAIPHLSSAVPRPYMRPSRTTGSNGGTSHSVRVGGGLDVVVGVEQHGRGPDGPSIWPNTAGWPPLRSRIRTSGRPASRRISRGQLGARLHVRAVVALVADRRDRDERRELVGDARPVCGDDGRGACRCPWRRSSGRAVAQGERRSIRQPSPSRRVSEPVVQPERADPARTRSSRGQEVAAPERRSRHVGGRRTARWPRRAGVRARRGRPAARSGGSPTHRSAPRAAASRSRRRTSLLGHCVDAPRTLIWRSSSRHSTVNARTGIGRELASLPALVVRVEDESVGLDPAKQHVPHRGGAVGVRRSRARSRSRAARRPRRRRRATDGTARSGRGRGRLVGARRARGCPTAPASTRGSVTAPHRTRRAPRRAPGRIRTCAPGSGGRCSIP